ncbi:MAG: peptidylprolyl isomerase [Gammaproteobacteria bacterium]|nr:MAG: peptidylprolyl isomerase [Gammaproteobacteria bacterium]
MNHFIKSKNLLIAISLVGLSLLSTVTSQATIVRFETTLGDIEVNLYDQTTPLTVANFLQYLNNGDYANVVFHRAETNFVLQGGGFAYTGIWPLDGVSTTAPVNNEPVHSNVTGTIAMAKLGGDPDSATNQWFFNLGDNSLNLDRQNGGFTVFGEVIGDGMTVISEIVALQRYNLGGAFTSIPLQNYDVSNDPNDTNLMIINTIVVLDDAIDSAAGLNPPANIGPVIVVDPPAGSGGGTFGYLMLGLALLSYRKFYKS